MSKKAQGILEYTILLAVVIAVIVFVMMSSNAGIKKGLDDAYDKSAKALSKAAVDIDNTVFH
ncbi:hypothetical protein D4R78_03010 [bacterium]|nr:MAG: hypothetical protein D4R78_03010 [bacterium]